MTATNPDAQASNSPPENPQHPKETTAALALGAVGVVYGDIGTSPIYALREAIKASAGDAPPLESDVLGVLSIIVWSLTLVVSIKYALFVLRADNNGEGGTLSIMALAQQRAGRLAPIVLGLGIVGTALFFGDALITPAISVLSAVEGLEVVTPAMTSLVVPITVAIIVALFAVQRFGTTQVARVFGPITAIWFAALAIVGVMHILNYPYVLWALNPLEAVSFLVSHSDIALLVIGAAFLAVTGAEALYADLGHFGRKPMVLAWFAIVFPALVINYFGQGAYVLSHGGAVGQPLFEMVPAWATLPMVVLATMATVIASQATITGAYSITRQAVQLHLLPRMTIAHTSVSQSGQVYLPRVNWLLQAGVVWLVLAFGSSSALAAAYGISVTGVMIVTAILLFVVMWRVWNWPLWLAAAVIAPFAVVDLAFLWANALKIPEGGWASLAVAALVILVMATWTKGTRILFDKTRKNEIPLDFLADNLASKPPKLVLGTAVFLTSDSQSAPTALMHSHKHYKVLHENNVILSVVTDNRPRVPESERVAMETLNPLFMRVTLNFGYMEQPNIPKAMAICRKQGWKFDIMATSFFLSRRSLKPAANSGMPHWQDRLYIQLARTASDATEYFQIPTGRVVEIGTQVAI
ncbi:MAG: potassium transporter Kup [Hyphomicrobiales bacterium]|nr:potassium transporter Kup [Hyphomicrobiales bacterium]